MLDDCTVLKFPASDLNIRRDGAEQIARKVFNAFLEGELFDKDGNLLVRATSSAIPTPLPGKDD